MVAIAASERRPWSKLPASFDYVLRFFLAQNQVTTLLACFVGGMLLVQWLDFDSPESSNSRAARPTRMRVGTSNGECGLYLARSAIPNGGLGIFVGRRGIAEPNRVVGFPDVCIYVADTPRDLKQLRSHSYGYGTFFGQFEGSNSRAACEGLATLMNTMVGWYLYAGCMHVWELLYSHTLSWFSVCILARDWSQYQTGFSNGRYQCWTGPIFASRGRSGHSILWDRDDCD
jgi:hypothetical protein